MMEDDLDLDSPSFDSQLYVRNYLKSHTVQDLIKHHNQLQTEIKDYDQNIQTLVFDNYSKFISSIDTVRQMKTDITKVESKMTRLTDSMNRIASLSSRIDSSLSVKRREIIKLDTVNKDLSKLNNLCNLPHVIQKDLDVYYRMIQARTQSVRRQPTNFDEYFNDSSANYQQCFQMLEKYKNEPLIQPIHKETTYKLEQVRQVLWNALLEFKQQSPLLQLYQNPESSQISTEEARSAVKKLMALMDDEEAVLRHYQKMIKERYMAITKELIEKAAVPKVANENFQVVMERELWRFLEERNFQYNIDDLEEFKQKREKELNDSSVQGSLLWLINQLCNIVFRQLRSEAHFQLNQLVFKNPNTDSLSEQCIKEIIYYVFTGLSTKMSQHKLNNFQVNEVFKKLQSELQSLFAHAQLRPRIKQEVSDKFSENVENICRGQVLGSFSALRSQTLWTASNTICTNLAVAQQQLKSRIMVIEVDYMELEGEVKREVYAQVTYFKQKVTASLLLCLLDLRGFVNIQQQSYIKDPTTYVNLIQGSLIDFCRFLPQLLGHSNFSHELLTSLALLDQNKGRLPELLQQGSLYCVFVSCFLQLYHKTLQQKLLQQMQEVFPNRGVRLPTENEVNKLEKTVSVGVQKNLSNFTQKCTKALLESFFEEGQNSAEGIRSQALKTVGVLKGVLVQVQVLFPDQKRGLVKKPSIKRESEGGLNIQMERVMVRKCRAIDILSDGNSRSNVLNSVLKFFLKVVLQRLRKGQVIESNDNRNLQIDIHFILQIIYELVSVDEEGLIVGFYLEMLEAIQQKCYEEVKISQKQLEVYSSQGRQQVRL